MLFNGTALELLTPAQRVDALKQGKLVSLKRQESLGAYLRLDAHWYLVVQGLLRIELAARQGVATAGFLKKGDFVSEFSGQAPETSHLGLRAVVDSDIYCLPASMMCEALQSNPALACGLFQSANERLRKLYLGIGRMTSAPADVTVGRTLFELSQPAEDGKRVVDGRITQKEIAGAVGLSREQVNKVLRQLEHRGLVVRAQQGYVVDEAFSSSKISPLLDDLKLS